jgi:hypothetical protein
MVFTLHQKVTADTKLRRMRWVESVACMGEMKNLYDIEIRKS